MDVEPTGLRHRLDVASRVLAGVGGGYALTAAATALLSLTLPLARGTAVYTATMLSFAIFTGAIVWAFSVGSRWVWPGILVPALVFAGLVRLIQTGGVP